MVEYDDSSIRIRQMTEEELKAGGITPSTVRLSIGTEHIDDILEDLEQGFRAIL